MTNDTHCSICGAEFVPSNCTTGYGVHPVTNEKHCFACCGIIDEWGMQEGQSTTLYLTHITRYGANYTQGRLTNWPGTLSIPVHHERKGRHNMARVRYDVWFTFAGHKWHGVQYGDNTQLCYCKVVKR